MQPDTDSKNAFDESEEEATEERAELSGLDVVLDALTGEDFPIDKETLYYSVGDIDVPGPHGKNIPMRSVLDQMSQTEFETLGQAVTAIKKALHFHQEQRHSKR